MHWEESSLVWVPVARVDILRPLLPPKLAGATTMHVPAAYIMHCLIVQKLLCMACRRFRESPVCTCCWGRLPEIYYSFCKDCSPCGTDRLLRVCCHSEHSYTALQIGLVGARPKTAGVGCQGQTALIETVEAHSCSALPSVLLATVLRGSHP